MTNASAGESLAINAVVLAQPGTHTYRLETDFNQVIAGVPILSYATLTAMTVPRDGTGAAPSKASESPTSPESVDAVVGG